MINRWLLCVTLFLSCSVILYAKVEKNPYLDEARELEKRTLSVDAEREYRRGIAFAKTQLSEQALSDAIYSLGQFYRRIGRHSDAITELSESLVLQTRLTGAQDVRTGRRLAELAAAYLQNNEVSEARAVISKLEPISSRFSGSERKFVRSLSDAVAELSKKTDEFNRISVAAAQGDVEARYALAACYENGIGVAPDSARAFHIYSELADAGHRESQFYLGVMYDKARGVSRDATKAAVWYRKAADAGLPVAQYNYAVLLSRGDGVERNRIEALMWAKKAQQGDYPGAARVVAIIERELAQENGAPKPDQSAK